MIRTVRTSQRGSAMLVTMIVVSSLVAGATILVSMQLASNRSSDITRTGLSATYCAEAGLSAARTVVGANYTLWAAALTSCGAGPYPCAEPAWLSAGIGSHDLDGNGTADFTVYIRDNDDEFNANPNDLTHDSDLRIFIVSRCTKYADTVKEVEELIEYTGGGQLYRDQKAFGAAGTGNRN